MMSDSIGNLLVRLIPHSLVGGTVIVVFVGVGWWEGRHGTRWATRIVSRWYQAIIGPLLATRSYLRRALIIALNNSAVCLALVLLGSLPKLAWVGLAAVGLGLGVALRIMLRRQADRFIEGMGSAGSRKLLPAVGIGLNMLEPPAILLSAGLNLGQGALGTHVSLPGSLQLYLVAVLPLLVIAALGEALWMGAVIGPAPDSRLAE